MKLKVEQLSQHLQDKLLPVYLVSGDEELLRQEACDQIRKQARDKGFADRELFHGDKGDVETFSSAVTTMSLFAELKIYEFRFNKSIVADFGKAFQDWCENPPQDQILLISCPKLDKSATNKAWYKKLEKLGMHITILPIDSKNLPGWLANRARQKNLTVDAKALNVLAQRVEGNLLAAEQELQRLSLLYGTESTISEEMMREYVADNARYDSFELLEASFSGDAKRLTRILSGLKNEGEAVAKINGLLTYELRTINKMAWDCQQGETPAQIISKYRIWGNKKTGYSKSLYRYPAKVWQRLLSRCFELDKIIKGQQKGDPWTVLESILLLISGNNVWKAKS